MTDFGWGFEKAAPEPPKQEFRRYDSPSSAGIGQELRIPIPARGLHPT